MDTKTFFGKQYIQILITLILVGAVAALASYAYYTLKQSEGVYTGAATITVVGEGKIMAVPDIGVFSFSVLAEGTDAAAAQTKSAESINTILAYLKASGVEEKDIKTENYSLNPKYTYETKPCPSFTYCPPSNPVIDGYEVSQTVTVKVRNLDTAGDLITGAGENGATNISSLQFTIDDVTVLKAEARKEAIVEAKAKANQLAKDLGVSLVRMTGYWEDQNGNYPMMDQAYSAMGGEASFKAVSPEMPVGENEINTVVNISYEIK